MGTIRKRLNRLEQASMTTKDASPNYISLTPAQTTRGELPFDLPAGWKGKVYVGVSPDDWDTPGDDR